MLLIDTDDFLSFEDEPEWDRLKELLEDLKQTE